MNVSDATKQAFANDGVHKTVRIVFPGLSITVTNNQIDKETLKIKESLISGSKFEIIGCIASVLTVNVYNLTTNIKGARIEVYIKAGETQEIPIFKGIVDSAIRQSDRRVRAITAYDEIYRISDVDVASWYKSLNFTKSIKEIRDSLFSTLGIVQESTTLINDNVYIEKQYDPNELNALEVIKNICQINAVFGRINRNGKFEYITPRMPSDTGGVFPGSSTFPSSNLFPSSTGHSGSGITEFSFYKNADYEDYTVNPIDKVTIRENSNDVGISSGDGINNYIIQGNIFTYKLASQTISSMATRIKNALDDFYYIPFNAQLMGAPYLECGKDFIKISVLDDGQGVNNEQRVDKIFNIFERELTGVQLLTDSFKAEGEENQRIFITDLNTNVDKIEAKVEEAKEDISDLDDRVTALENADPPDVGLKVEVVDYIPSTGDPNTLYLVRGVVILE